MRCECWRRLGCSIYRWRRGDVLGRERPWPGLWPGIGWLWQARHRPAQVTASHSAREGRPAQWQSQRGGGSVAHGRTVRRRLEFSGEACWLLEGGGGQGNALDTREGAWTTCWRGGELWKCSVLRRVRDFACQGVGHHGHGMLWCAPACTTMSRS